MKRREIANWEYNMIGKLTGIIDSIDTNTLILDVNGVGYILFASARTLAQIGQIGDRISLNIETHVREDHIHLYAFQTAEEQHWFKHLTSVQGVGMKVGLAILNACAPEQLLTAIMAQDKAPITRADGVGPKLATRIITELKDKVGDWAMAPALQSGSASASATSTPTSSPSRDNTASSPSWIMSNNIQSDALSALENLGYGRSEAMQAVIQVQSSLNDNEDIDIGKLIRLSLKQLSV